MAFIVSPSRFNILGGTNPLVKTFLTAHKIDDIRTCATKFRSNDKNSTCGLTFKSSGVSKRVAKVTFFSAVKGPPLVGASFRDVVRIRSHNYFR